MVQTMETLTGRMNSETGPPRRKPTAWDLCSAETAFCTIWALSCHPFQRSRKNLLFPCRHIGMARLSMIPSSEFEWLSLIRSIHGIQSLNWSNQLAKPRRSAISSKRVEDCITSVTKLTTWSQGYARHAIVGLVIVANPAPAVAFAGRRIAWVCSKRRLLMELLERKQSVRS